MSPADVTLRAAEYHYGRTLAADLAAGDVPIWLLAGEDCQPRLYAAADESVVRATVLSEIGEEEWPAGWTLQRVGPVDALQRDLATARADHREALRRLDLAALALDQHAQDAQRDAATIADLRSRLAAAERLAAGQRAPGEPPRCVGEETEE